MGTDGRYICIERMNRIKLKNMEHVGQAIFVKSVLRTLSPVALRIMIPLLDSHKNYRRLDIWWHNDNISLSTCSASSSSLPV